MVSDKMYSTATAWFTSISHTKERFLQQALVDHDHDTAMTCGVCVAPDCRSLARVFPTYCSAVLSPRLSHCSFLYDMKLPWNG